MSYPYCTCKICLLSWASEDLLKALQGLIVAAEAEVNEKGGGGLILARLTDARAAVAKATIPPAQRQGEA